MSVWSRTMQIFKKRPLLMNMVSFGTMYVGAEITQQCILLRIDPKKKAMDWNNVGRYAVIGLVAIGPTLFYWYRILDSLLPAATGWIVMRKALTDQLMSWRRFVDLFQKKPLLMNMVTFGSMYVAAETSQQVLRVYLSPDKKSIDWKSIQTYAVLGIVTVGPVLFYWYRFLDNLLPPGLKGCVTKKLMADMLICSPFTVAQFYICMSILERKKDIFAELKAKFVPTYTVSCCFWLPAQAINFGFLPPYTRVAFVGCASFVWVNILCLMKRKEVAESEKDVEIVTGL